MLQHMLIPLQQESHWNSALKELQKVYLMQEYMIQGPVRLAEVLRRRLIHSVQDNCYLQ